MKFLRGLAPALAMLLGLATQRVEATDQIQVTVPQVALRDIQVKIKVSLHPSIKHIHPKDRADDSTASIRTHYAYKVWRQDDSVNVPGPPADGTPWLAQGDDLLMGSEGTIALPLAFHDYGENVFYVAVYEPTTQGDLLYIGKTRATLWVIPGFLSVLPSVMTIAFALLLKQNILALFLGCWTGTFFVYRYNPVVALLRTVDEIAIESMADEDHRCILYFLLLIGGMIAVMNKSGGTLGMAKAVTRYANTKRSAEAVTMVIGCLTFFDDVASAFITGTTMRDLTGLHKISREKLSFLVDTCAATVPTMIVVSSWIGVELSQIKDNFDALGITKDAYMTYLYTILHRFYPILCLVFATMVIISGRDFGPMLRAEQRARRTGKLSADDAKPFLAEEDPATQPKKGVPERWYNAVVPLLALVLMIFGGITWQGLSRLSDRHHALQRDLADLDDAGVGADTPWRSIAMLERQDVQHQLSLEEGYSATAIFKTANPFHALLWASISGSILMIALVLWQRLMTLAEAMEAWMSGCRSMVFVVVILIQAWSLGDICTRLSTASYLAKALTASGGMDPRDLPTLVFILSAVIAFALGSGWGCMAILFPLVMPLAHELAPASDLVMLGVIASILSGAAMGNFISPMSDCFIMSSMASGCDATHHLQTQGVYALVVAVVSVLTCSLPVSYGLWSPWVGLLLGVTCLGFILWFFGERVDRQPIHEASTSCASSSSSSCGLPGYVLFQRTSFYRRCLAPAVEGMSQWCQGFKRVQ